MSLIADLKTLYHLALTPIRGTTHAERLESFYSGQADGYDAFRERLLKGRAELARTLEFPAGGVWVDFGGGTGANLENVGPPLQALSQVYIVDLSKSLLNVAADRIQTRGWTNVQPVEADATLYTPPHPVDLVTFSYSLTMIPDWFAAIDHALALLKPGGTIGVVDFYISRKHAEPPNVRHSWFTRNFLPGWFGSDNVFLTPDHVPYLQRRFETVHFSEHRSKIPYLPLVRAPYYLFIGRKPAK